MRRQLRYYIVFLGVIACVVAACGAPAATPTPTPAPSAAPTATPVPIPSATLQPTVSPASDQVAAGEQRFATYCQSCHGPGFATVYLNGYRTAQNLFEFIKARMPPGNPNVLSQQSRYDIVAFLLAKAELMPATQVVSADTLASIVWAQPTLVPATSQYASGEELFGIYCRSCHRTGIEQSELRRYRTAAALVQFIQTSMPPGNPGLLSEQQTFDIVDYLLTRASLIEEDESVDAENEEELSFE